MSRILLVEDSRVQAMLAIRMLKKAGYEVEHASTGEQALKVCYDSPPDIVLQDQHLAEMSGLEVCRRIKNDIALSSIPVLALTAGNKEKDHLAALDAGADSFLPKDSPTSQLLAVIARLIAATAAIRDSQSHPQPGRTRILAIDDSETFRATFTKKLVESGFEVQETAEGNEGLSLLKQHAFDVAVVDLVMPEINGIEFCKQARAWAEQEHLHLGLLLLTGSDRQNVLVEALEAGADDYVSKLQDMDIILAHTTALARRIVRAKRIQAIAKTTDGSGYGPTRQVICGLMEEIESGLRRILDSGSKLLATGLTEPQNYLLDDLTEAAKDLSKLVSENKTVESPVSRSKKPVNQTDDDNEVVDWDEANRRIPPGMVNEIAELLLVECPKLMGQINEALEANNADKLRLSAHSLKGSTMSVGAKRVHAAAEKLEKMGESKELSDGLETFKQLKAEVDQMCKAIRAKISD